jgi:hypothetical protein
MTKKEVIFLILLVVFGLLFRAVGGHFRVSLGKQEEPKESVETVVKPTKYDIVLACQKKASQATQEGWKYGDCLKELEDATDNLKIRLN